MSNAISPVLGRALVLDPSSPEPSQPLIFHYVTPTSIHADIVPFASSTPQLDLHAPDPNFHLDALPAPSLGLTKS